MTPEQRTHAMQLATDYCLERPQLGITGVVILFNGEAIGWMNTLRDPQNWQPGALAIDTQGNLWIATGGDSYNGAGQWQPLDDEQHQEQHQEPEQSPATPEPATKVQSEYNTQRIIRKAELQLAFRKINNLSMDVNLAELARVECSYCAKSSCFDVSVYPVNTTSFGECFCVRIFQDSAIECDGYYSEATHELDLLIQFLTGLLGKNEPLLMYQAQEEVA